MRDWLEEAWVGLTIWLLFLVMAIVLWVVFIPTINWNWKEIYFTQEQYNYWYPPMEKLNLINNPMYNVFIIKDMPNDSTLGVLQINGVHQRNLWEEQIMDMGNIADWSGIMHDFNTSLLLFLGLPLLLFLIVPIFIFVGYMVYSYI